MFQNTPLLSSAPEYVSQSLEMFGILMQLNSNLPAFKRTVLNPILSINSQQWKTRRSYSQNQICGSEVDHDECYYNKQNYFFIASPCRSVYKLSWLINKLTTD